MLNKQLIIKQTISKNKLHKRESGMINYPKQTKMKEQLARLLKTNNPNIWLGTHQTV